MSEENEVWITDRPVTDGPGMYNIVAMKGKVLRHVAHANREEAMRIVAMRKALVELQEMMGPKMREAFVAQGMRAFAAVLRIVVEALK